MLVAVHAWPFQTCPTGASNMEVPAVNGASVPSAVMETAKV
jgi:hypothetical protein